jgi:hypothetical protein
VVFTRKPAETEGQASKAAAGTTRGGVRQGLGWKRIYVRGMEAQSQQRQRSEVSGERWWFAVELRLRFWWEAFSRWICGICGSAGAKKDQVTITDTDVRVLNFIMNGP